VAPLSVSCVVHCRLAATLQRITCSLAKRTYKDPEKFGTGHPEGLVEAGANNNAAVCASRIPAHRCFPGNAVTAIAVGVLVMKGLIPANADDASPGLRRDDRLRDRRVAFYRRTAKSAYLDRRWALSAACLSPKTG